MRSSPLSRSPARLLGALALLAAGTAPGTVRSAHAAPLVDAAPIWWEDDRADGPQPAVREPNLLRDQFTTTVVRPLHRNAQPARLLRRAGTLFGGSLHREAANPNTLDEVPNSTWFTNRIGLFPMEPRECADPFGPGPDRAGPWTVVRAKTEGVTPGFNVRDAKGSVYVIKFDPPGELGVTTGAGAISGRILAAAGYNVPEDVIVTFGRGDLVLGEGVTVPDDLGRDRPMTERDLDAVLEKAEKTEDGRYHAIASRFLDGVPVGPFDFEGKRKDDPNDRIHHHHRRELRGLRVFAAWLNHFDTKQANTLDMWVEEDGRRFVRHYLIDFASTLGSGASGAEPMHSMEYGFDLWETLARLLSAGLREDAWRRLERREDLPEVGYWWSDGWDPTAFKPLTPNGAFARMTDRDGYWAAKIVSAFADEHLAAICETARFRDPEATAWVARVLAERRDLIARHWFTRECPLDFFRVEEERLVAVDLGVRRGLWAAGETRVRVRSWAAGADRDAGARLDWRVVPEPEVELPAGESAERPFLAFEFQVDRGGGWGPSVVAWVASASRRVVAVDR